MFFDPQLLFSPLKGSTHMFVCNHDNVSTAMKKQTVVHFTG